MVHLVCCGVYCLGWGKKKKKSKCKKYGPVKREAEAVSTIRNQTVPCSGQPVDQLIRPSRAEQWGSTKACTTTAMFLCVTGKLERRQRKWPSREFSVCYATTFQQMCFHLPVCCTLTLFFAQVKNHLKQALKFFCKRIFFSRVMETQWLYFAFTNGPNVPCWCKKLQ